MARKVALGLCLGVALGLFLAWDSCYVYFNRESLLRKTYARYSTLLDVRACDQAADFLSDESKKGRYAEFMQACLDGGYRITLYDDSRVIFLDRYHAMVQLKRGRATYTTSWVVQGNRWKRAWPHPVENK
jgi:hypothetical protein